MKFNIVFIVGFLLTSCSNATTVDNYRATSNSKQNIYNSLDTILKCNNNEFSVSENYAFYPDYGCLYQDSNMLGDVQVYLFSKVNQTDKLSESKIRTFSSNQIKEYFNIYVRVIEPQYLTKLHNGDSPYYVVDGAKPDVYKYDKSANKWLTVKSKMMIDQEPLTFYLVDQIKDSNINGLPITILQDIKHDLDGDGKKDRLIAYKDINQQENNFNTTILILKGTHNSYEYWDSNNSLLKNYHACMLDGFDKLVAKDGYFTVEHDNCFDRKHALIYSTFKYEQPDSIILHKQSISFYLPENTKDIHCTYSKTNSFSGFNGECGK